MVTAGKINIVNVCGFLLILIFFAFVCVTVISAGHYFNLLNGGVYTSSGNFGADDVKLLRNISSLMALSNNSIKSNISSVNNSLIKYVNTGIVRLDGNNLSIRMFDKGMHNVSISCSENTTIQKIDCSCDKNSSVPCLSVCFTCVQLNLERLYTWSCSQNWICTDKTKWNETVTEESNNGNYSMYQSNLYYWGFWLNPTYVEINDTGTYRFCRSNFTACSVIDVRWREKPELSFITANFSAVNASISARKIWD